MFDAYDAKPTGDGIGGSQSRAPVGALLSIMPAFRVGVFEPAMCAMVIHRYTVCAGFA